MYYSVANIRNDTLSKYVLYYGEDILTIAKQVIADCNDSLQTCLDEGLTMDGIQEQYTCDLADYFRIKEANVCSKNDIANFYFQKDDEEVQIAGLFDDEVQLKSFLDNEILNEISFRTKGKIPTSKLGLMTMGDELQNITAGYLIYDSDLKCFEKF